MPESIIPESDRPVNEDFFTENVLRLVGELGNQTKGMPRSMEGFLTDLERVQWLVETHPDDGEEPFEALYRHYCQAPAPREGERATM